MTFFQNTKLRTALEYFRDPLRPPQTPRKYLFLGLTGILFLLLLAFTGRVIERNLIGRRLVLAAGNETGSSYRFGRALKKVVEANSAIRIDVCATDGTDDNIRALEKQPLLKDAICISDSGQPTSSLKADLITAQADRLYLSLTSTAETPAASAVQQNRPAPASLPQVSSARAIAVLYQDHFQLILNPRSFGATNPETFDISQLSNATIGTPQAGGQRPSLKILSTYFGFQYRSLDLNLSRQDSDQQCQRVQALDAVFRIRRLGNSEIKRFVDCGWFLVAIPQADALQRTKYPAYKSSSIPQGAYQGAPAIPPAELETIAVDRLIIKLPTGSSKP